VTSDNKDTPLLANQNTEQ